MSDRRISSRTSGSHIASEARLLGPDGLRAWFGRAGRSWGRTRARTSKGRRRFHDRVYREGELRPPGIVRVIAHGVLHSAVPWCRIDLDQEIFRAPWRQGDFTRLRRLTATTFPHFQEDQSSSTRVGYPKLGADHVALTDRPQVTLRAGKDHAWRGAVRMVGRGPCGQPSGGKPCSKQRSSENGEDGRELLEASWGHLSRLTWFEGEPRGAPNPRTHRNGPSPIRSS